MALLRQPLRSWLWLALALIFAIPAAAEEGYYLEEEVTRESPGRPSTKEKSQTWMVADKLRKEEARSGSVTIFREDKSLLWVLDVAAKTYFEVTRAEMDAMGRQSVAMLLPETEDPGTWLERTGKTKKVGHWQAYEVRVEDRPVQGMTLTMWLSEDVPIDREIRDRFGRSMFGEGNPAAALLKGLRELDGYPVEVLLSVRLGNERIQMRQRLRKVEPRDVESDRFEIPDGYVRVPSPFGSPEEDGSFAPEGR